MTTSYLWTPPPVYSLPVRGKAERMPINRLFFVGRNYHAHAVEMITKGELAMTVNARALDSSAIRPVHCARLTHIPRGNSHEFAAV